MGGNGIAGQSELSPCITDRGRKQCNGRDAPEQARKAMARLRQLDPALRVSNLLDMLGPYRRTEDLSRYDEGLRQAGLPE